MKERNYNSRTEKDYNFLRALYYQVFVVLVVIPVSKLFYKLKVEGRENVPKESRVIYAGNHVSYLPFGALLFAEASTRAQACPNASSRLAPPISSKVCKTSFRLAILILITFPS